MGKKNKKDKYVELDEQNIFMKIPENTIGLTLAAKYIGDDGEVHTASKSMSAKEIMSARQDFLDYVEDGDDYDVRYVITDEGRKFMEELAKKRRCADSAGEEAYD